MFLQQNLERKCYNLHSVCLFHKIMLHGICGNLWKNTRKLISTGLDSRKMKGFQCMSLHYFQLSTISFEKIQFAMQIHVLLKLLNGLQTKQESNRQHTFIKLILIPLTDHSTEITSRINCANLNVHVI